jgi:hypothetical protein
MQPFTTSQGFNVYPPTEEGRYLVSHPAQDPGEWVVYTLRDECSCAAIQGIACDHKTAVDEYVEAAAAQITAEAEPRAELTQAATASHRPTYTRKQVGTTDSTPPRPLWATDVTCSCGWTDTAEASRTKDEAKAIYRKHRDEAENITPAPIYKTREEWLTEAVRHIHARAALLQLGDNPPALRVACGFTYGKGRRIGECWRKEQSGDGVFEIIIHNKLDDPVAVLECLTHEVGHTYMERNTGHRAPFRRWAKTMGLAGQMTATYAGEELRTWLIELAATLGTYPHAALDSAQRIREGGPKKQTNRWLKYVCEDPGCGWIVRAPKVGLKMACLGDAHANEPRLMLPGFTIESEDVPEQEDIGE